MAKKKTRSQKPAGAPPGTISYVGRERTAPVVVTRLRYSNNGAEEPQEISANECVPENNPNAVTWYTVDGVHDVEVLRVIGENFKLHPLVVEDLANTTQRPKLEEFEQYLFIALKMITYDSSKKAITAEHVSIILGDGWVLSFLEDAGDVFEPVRQRIRSGKGRIRKMKADYLAYALMDAIVDFYFQVLEQIGEDIENVEQEVVDRPQATTLKSVHMLKRELIFLRRSVWPIRETVNSLIRDESDLVTEETRIFLRDLYDHAIHTIDTIETQRDIVSGMLDVYLSSISNKMNQVMKLLTVMSSIFIPLTFIAGIYGMNFEYMPELTWVWGYPVVLGSMTTLALSLLVFFRRKGWL
jgi:magnesium transporter